MGEDRAPRILVVDNDATSAGEAKAHLESEGFRVEISEGASGAALWFAQAFRPWVVVVRHDLPSTDGIEVCRLLKQDGETNHIQVILNVAPSTARKTDDKLTVRALEAGASLVLPTGFSKELLVAHVYAQLNVFQMVMELRERNHFLRDLVQRDPMTGLFNHAYLHELLERELSRSARTRSPVSLMLVDIDHFKQINDSHGHQAGDYCLKTTAELLSTGGRRADAVARYGGDEFALVLPDTPRAGAAVRAEALRASMQSRAFADRKLPGVTLSIGVATFPDDGREKTALLAAADRALYAAKRIGRNRVVAYSADLGSGDDSAVTDAGPELERLLALGDVVQKRMASFVYQPILSAETGEIYAHEALCRPKHAAFPHAGALFATAERAGRVAELGRELRQVAVEPLAKLAPPTLLFLNLHPLELSDALVDEAMTIHERWAGRIVFEITESAQIHDYERMRTVISTLQRAGFKVAIDDLGAGYAGLNSLAMLRPDIVKLDMGLVRGLQRDTTAARLIRHLLDFAIGEGILVVAEGVETAEERRVVGELGVPLLQGYYFAKPGPAFPEVKALNAWLSTSVKRPAARKKRAVT